MLSLPWSLLLPHQSYFSFLCSPCSMSVFYDADYMLPFLWLFLNASSLSQSRSLGRLVLAYWSYLPTDHLCLTAYCGRDTAMCPRALSAWHTGHLHATQVGEPTGLSSCQGDVSRVTSATFRSAPRALHHLCSCHSNHRSSGSQMAWLRERGGLSDSHATMYEWENSLMMLRLRGWGIFVTIT